MAGFLFLTLVLMVLIEPGSGIEFHKKCCPEVEHPVVLTKYRNCVEGYLALNCETEMHFSFLFHSDSYFWFIKDGRSVVVTSNFILPYDSFCTATIIDSENGESMMQKKEGIVYCNETKFYAKYHGPEPFSYSICNVISAIGCSLTFLIYILVATLRRDLTGKCLVNTLFCYTAMFLMLGVLAFGDLPQSFCSYQFFFTFFCITASISWTYILHLEMWHSVLFIESPVNEAFLLKQYYSMGWGMPIILSFNAVVFQDLRAIGVGNDCHISTVYLFASHAQPVLALQVFMLFQFTWALYTLWRQCKSCCQFVRHATVYYKKLFLLTNIPWIICIIAAYFPETPALSTVLNMMTALQGILFFFVLVVYRKIALISIAEELANWGLPYALVIRKFAAKLHDEDNNRNDLDKIVIQINKDKKKQQIYC